jgi:hypothetical protein
MEGRRIEILCRSHIINYTTGNTYRYKFASDEPYVTTLIEADGMDGARVVRLLIEAQHADGQSSVIASTHGNTIGVYGLKRLIPSACKSTPLTLVVQCAGEGYLHVMRTTWPIDDTLRGQLDDQRCICDTTTIDGESRLLMYRKDAISLL